VGTQQAVHDAEAMVTKSRNCFGDVIFLSPLGFHYFNGDDVPDKMHKIPWPANACFLEARFELPFSCLDAPFSVYQCCNMTYWLHLPQSGHQEKKDTAAASSSTSSSVTARSSLFSVATNLQSKFTFTPGVVVTGDGGSVPPNVINLSGGTPVALLKQLVARAPAPLVRPPALPTATKVERPAHQVMVQNIVRVAPVIVTVYLMR